LLMDMVAAGGYRPPLLEPVNFMALYQQHAHRRAESAASAPSSDKSPQQEA
jgi:preprotein translocase subunit SecB